MKYLMYILTVFSLVSLIACASANQMSKIQIAYIDRDEVFNNYNGAEKIRILIEQTNKITELQLKNASLSNQDKQKIVGEAKARNEKLKLALIETIDQYIAEFAHKNSIKVILGSADGKNLIYLDPEVDITEQILTGLNNQIISPSAN